MLFAKKYRVTAEKIEMFSVISGDKNPIHLDKKYCKKHSIFKKPIAHGMLIGSFISATIAEYYGPGVIYLSQDMDFLKPVFINDTVVIELHSEGIDAKKKIDVMTRVTRLNDVIIKGRARLLLTN